MQIDVCKINPRGTPAPLMRHVGVEVETAIYKVSSDLKTFIEKKVFPFFLYLNYTFKLMLNFAYVDSFMNMLRSTRPKKKNKIST